MVVYYNSKNSFTLILAIFKHENQIQANVLSLVQFLNIKTMMRKQPRDGDLPLSIKEDEGPKLGLLLGNSS